MYSKRQKSRVIRISLGSSLSLSNFGKGGGSGLPSASRRHPHPLVGLRGLCSVAEGGVSEISASDSAAVLNRQMECDTPSANTQYCGTLSDRIPSIHRRRFWVRPDAARQGKVGILGRNLKADSARAWHGERPDWLLRARNYCITSGKWDGRTLVCLMIFQVWLRERQLDDKSRPDGRSSCTVYRLWKGMRELRVISTRFTVRPAPSSMRCH
jgi:hypothetical protein